MKSPDQLAARFRAAGRKVTPQRLGIFGVVAGSTEHPSAELVWDRVRAEMPTISLKTVYQTLNELAELGEIQALDLGTGSLRFDPTAEAHHHLVCRGCGRVQDVHADFTDVQVPEAAGDGFVVSSTEIVFRGWCPACTGMVAATH